MKSIKIKKSFTDVVKTVLLFLLMLYAFIPFETGGSSLAYKIHMLFLVLITLFALYIGKIKIKFNRLGKVTIFILLISILITLILNDVMFWPIGLIYLTSIIFALITANIIQNSLKFRSYFLLSLKYIIIVSIVLLFLQISIFALTKNILPFHEMLFPFSEARIGIDKSFEGLYRMGGLYIEPGTYSNWMYIFLMLYIILTKKIYSPLVIIGSISLIFSYSTWGMVFGVFLLTLSLSTKLKTSSLKTKSLVIILFLSMSYFYISYFANTKAVSFATHKLTVGNSSSEEKKEAYEVFFNNIEKFLFVGEGFEPTIFEGIGSYQDAGIILNLAVTFGILFTVLIIFIYIISYVKAFNITMLFASLPIFVGKLYFYDPVFWLFFFIIIYNGYKKTKMKVI